MSSNEIEALWRMNESITITIQRANSVFYYFILPSTIEYPDTAEYRRIIVDEMDEYDDPDYYARLILGQLIKNLTARLTTRKRIKSISESIPFDPIEPVYHQAFLEGLKTMNTDKYEELLIEQTARETQDFIDTELYYRPGAPGFEEVKNEFEDIILLMTMR